MNKFTVGIGEVLWDVFPEGKKLGGAPGNFAYHAGQFGRNSTVISAVGNDDLGKEILKQFAERKIAHNLQIVDTPTGTVQVTLNERGVPQYEIVENVAWDNIAYTDEMRALAANTECVCFGSLAQRGTVSGDTIRRFVADVPETALKVFDINLRQHFYSKEQISESLKACNILKINDEELDIVSPMFDLDGDQPTRCRQLLERFGLKALVLTCGENGSYAFTSDEMTHFDTPKVKVADTVGAGDSFTAAFCASLLMGKPLKEAHRKAVDVSAFVCTQSGAMPVLPDDVKA